MPQIIKVLIRGAGKMDDFFSFIAPSFTSNVSIVSMISLFKKILNNINAVKDWILS